MVSSIRFADDQTTVNVDTLQQTSAKYDMKTNGLKGLFPLRLHCTACCDIETNFQLIQWEPFPLQLRCAALCDRYRNADSVSMLLFTI